MPTYIYATLTDLQTHVDKRLLIQLSNDDDTTDPLTGSANETVLAAMENEAASTVNNFLRNVYTLPLAGATLTSEIVRMVAKLTLANLWERRGGMPDNIKEMKGRVYGRLRRISKAASDEQLVAPRDDGNGGQPIRSSKGKAATMFDASGYFDGLRSRGARTLQGDSDNEAAQ